MCRMYKITFLIVTFLFVVLLQGCGQNKPSSTSTTTSTTSEQSTSTTIEKTKITLYFAVDNYSGVAGPMFLVRETREISSTSDIEKTAVEELIKGSGDTGRISFIPKNAKIISFSISDSVATVDFSKEVLNANVGSEGEALGIAQIVNTLTEFPAIKEVRFRVEGLDKGQIDGRNIEDWWGHVGLYEQPFSRNESVIQGAKVLTNTVQVEEPRIYTQIDNPFVIKGRSYVFEAQFNVRLEDSNGKVIVEKPVMSEGMDWGPFETSINYPATTKPGLGKVVFFNYSAKDGSEIEMGTVPVFIK